MVGVTAPPQRWTSDRSSQYGRGGSVSFGALLRRHRLAAGLTQEALAECAGVSAKAVSELERDPFRTPRLETVTLLADALRLDPDERARLLAAARPDHSPITLSLPSRDVPLHMPRQLTMLFGRDGVVEAVAELVRRGVDADGSRLLTLTGPGGVGKTRVAIAAAERAADAFTDGVVFVDLSPLRDSDLVLAAIALRLDVDERDKIPLHERLTALLCRKRMLLLLDNFEHLLPAREAVLTLLEACPRLEVLATSRVALRVRGEREYRIAPLELPDTTASPQALARSPAVALFLDRAQAAGADLELNAAAAPAVAEICRRLDGLPLAIELAAAWTRLLSPPSLLLRLEHRLPLLVWAPHDVPARQRTMRDVIAWSYDLLSAAEQQLFRRMCIFVGGSTADAVEAVCADAEDGAAVLVRLAALVDKSILRPRDSAISGAAEPRLTILETLREYGLEKLEERGEIETMRERHARYFLALAESAEEQRSGPDEAVSTVQLDREHDNLRASLRWSLDRRDRETALRFCGALWRFWSQRGHLTEGRQWLREALDLPVGAGATVAAARAMALVGSAQLAIDQGDYDDAERRSAEAIALIRERGTPADLIAALNIRGRMAREQGDYQDAVAHYEEALALARAQSNHPGEAAALIGLGYAIGFSGDIARGAAFTEQALGVLREVGDKRALASALGGMTAHLMHAGDFARAESAGTEALTLFRLLGDTGHVAGMLFGLGILSQYQERYERAAVLHEEALVLQQQRGDEHGTIEPLSALAAIALRQGDYQRAKVLLEEALEILERYEDRWVRAMSLAFLGHVDLAMGDSAGAAALFAEGASLMQAIGNPLHMPLCLEGLAGVAAARGNWDLAARLCGARDALHQSLGLGVPPADPTRYARTLASSRTALGDDDFSAEYEVGRSLSPEQVLAKAEQIILAASDC